jgi:integrase
MHSTLSELVELYLDVRGGELAEGTVYLTRRAWTALVAIVGDMPMDEFQPIHAERFKGTLLKHYRPASVQTFIKTVRPVFRWWAKHDQGFEDPFAGLAPVRVPKERPVAYQNDQVRAMLEAAATTRDQLRILLAYTTGMRRSEVLNLTWADVNFEQDVIYVQPKKETETTWHWQPKDKDYRIVPLTQEAKDLLLQIQMELPTSQPYPCLSEERYSLLQWRRSRGQMSGRMRRCPDSNRRPMQAIRKKAGVEGACLQHLRSTCFTTCAEQGVPLHVIQGLAGHSNIETTRRYYIATRPESLDQVRTVMSKSG